MNRPDPLSAGEFQSLPLEALHVLRQVSAPPRLLAHLVLVHDAACTLIDRISAEFPEAHLDSDLVRFGAATHDIGKTLQPDELTQPGKHQHQRSGVEVLESLGISRDRARFAWTHGHWDDDGITLEDFIVALADKSWKGKRIERLEMRTAELLSAATARHTWECYAKLDKILQDVSLHADRKLAWQASFSL